MTPVFFHPNLGSIHFDGPRSVIEDKDTLPALVHVLMRLPTDVPNLSKFSMRGFCSSSDALLPRISSTICSFRHLSYVSIEPAAITAQALLHLASLPCLTDLMTRLLSSDGDTIVAALKAPFDGVYFPKLRSLKLVYQDSFPVVSALIRATHSPNLEELEVTFRHSHIAVQDLKDVFCALAEHVSRSRLTRLQVRAAHLTASSPETLTSKQPVIDEDTLAPLLMLDGLTTLIFDIPTVPFFITNRTFGRLAHSWPKIQELHLGNQFPPTTSGRPPATLDALIFVAHFCPHLKTLTLPLNPHPDVLTDSRAMREAHPVLHGEHRALVSLNIGRSPIDGSEVAPAAAFLSGLFPALKDIDDSFAYGEDLIGEEDLEDYPLEEILRIHREVQYRTQWEKVLELHPKFVMVRKQEREWGRARSAIGSPQN